MTAIHEVVLGADRCYIIVAADGAIMIDGGSFPGMGGILTRELERLNLSPRQIRLIVLTHGHWDHIAGVRDIQQLTGAKIAIHRIDKHWLGRAKQPLPPAANLWGHILHGLMVLYKPFIKIPPAEVDVVLDDEDMSLESFGVAGRVIHTPGHTAGSVSVLLDSGDVFVGDMAMNGMPMRIGPGMPTFAEDVPTLRRSWKKLLDLDIKTVYPAHGKPFDASVMSRAVA